VGLPPTRGPQVPHHLNPALELFHSFTSNVHFSYSGPGQKVVAICHKYKTFPTTSARDFFFVFHRPSSVSEVAECVSKSTCNLKNLPTAGFLVYVFCTVSVGFIMQIPTLGVWISQYRIWKSLHHLLNFLFCARKFFMPPQGLHCEYQSHKIVFQVAANGIFLHTSCPCNEVSDSVNFCVTTHGQTCKNQSMFGGNSSKCYSVVL